MTPGYCSRLEAKIRRLGHPAKVAHIYAGFFLVSMVAVLSLFGYCVGTLVQRVADTGSGTYSTGPRIGLFVPVTSGIHSR